MILSLIRKLETNDSEFWKLLNSNDVWGGSGSIVDISLSAYSPQTKEEIKKDEYEWRCALIEIYKKMLQKNITNPRAEFAANTFKKWNEDGVGI